MDSLLETYIGKVYDILNDLEEIVEESDDPNVTAVIPYIEQMRNILSDLR